ncbi:outer membrane porin, OprD family [Pseudomonas yamanorum]|uniref:OprD family outer membrane porin n=1 Tax=Pseudomonas yamanorum TaxID=515393 RepID=UPI0015A3482E|nr:OprD family outer membrane porin [Pseudomonas yamanorum]NWD23602.1 outer membrane porin, OprD family [Pseudomonas yamanorum]
MKLTTLVVAVSSGVISQLVIADGSGGFLEDSHSVLSSRSMYYNADIRSNKANKTTVHTPDEREAATALRLDYASGFTRGTVGFGLDAQAIEALHLDGGAGHHLDGNANTFFPSDGDSAADNWSRINANVKFRIAKTELHVGGALAPVLPILMSSDSRLTPQTYQGGILTSRDIPDLKFTGGEINKAAGRASSNSTGLSVTGGTQGSESFRFGGLDYTPFARGNNALLKTLTAQYYYADLKDYYRQYFFGINHVLPIGDNQSFKTDLRYFDSTSDGKNGQAGYIFSNNGGYAKHAGKVDNRTYSAQFTYQLGGSAFMLGHLGVSDNGGFVWANQSSQLGPAPQGAGGADFYLFSNVMVGSFSRAGEQVNIGQYTYDFRSWVPGLKASFSYLRGDDIKSKLVGGSTQSEAERDIRLDYTVQSGPLKGFGTTVRTANYHGESTGTSSQDQARIIFNYTYTLM